MNVKKNIICVICMLLICIACFFTGRISTKRANNELSNQLRETQCRAEELEGQLGQRIYELEQMQSELDGIKGNIGDSIRLAEQAGDSIGQLGQTIRDFGNTTATGRELIKQLKEFNRKLKESVEQLLVTNSKLTEELGRL